MLSNIRNLFFTGLFLLLLVGQIKAVTVDNSSSLGDFTLGGTRAAPVTFVHNTGATANVLYVGVSNNRTLTSAPIAGGCPATLPPTGTVTAISYGTRTDFEPLTRSDLTAVATILSPNGCASIEVFRLKNPPSGQNTLSVTVPNGGDYLVIGAVTFIGVDTSTSPTGALAPNAGNSSNPSVNTPTRFNGIVLDTVAAEFNGLDLIENPSQIRQWRTSAQQDPNVTPQPPLNYVGAGSVKSAVNVSSVTTSWTLTNTANWAIGGVALKEITTASPAAISGQARTNFNQPMVNIPVFLQNLQTGEDFKTSTDINGRYYFENLEPGQIYQVKVFSFVYDFSPDNHIFNFTESLDAVDFVGSRKSRKFKF